MRFQSTIAINRFFNAGTGLTFCEDCAEQDAREGGETVEAPRTTEEAEWDETEFMCDGCGESCVIED